MLPPKRRCPWFLTGLALGLLLSAWCIRTGTEQARSAPYALTP